MSEKKGIQVKFDDPDYDRLENYRRSQPVIPTMAATVRTLVLFALKAASDDARNPKTSTTA
jgi:hypothetical protein